MVNITRFNPLEDAFDNLFRGLPMWVPAPERRAAQPAQFRMDVTENDKEYQVLAELPGVKKEEISITINGNEVAVAAEVKQEKDVKNGETVLRAERYYGAGLAAAQAGEHGKAKQHFGQLVAMAGKGEPRPEVTAARDWLAGH